MLRQVIRSLRDKPKETRNTVALGVASVVTLSVFVIWVYHIPDAFDDFNERKETGTEFGLGQFMEQVKEQASSVGAVLEQASSSKIDAAQPTKADEEFARYWAEYRDGVATSTSSSTDSLSVENTGYNFGESPAATNTPPKTTSIDSDAPRSVRLIAAPATSSGSTIVP